MPDMAFIVEGQMEQRTIAAICPGKKVVRIGTGGKNVNMGKMAEFIQTHFNLFSNRYFPTVVMFDREDRTETADHLHQELEKEITLRGMAINQFVISVADRDIETWIVPHVDPQGVFHPKGFGAGSVDEVSGQTYLEKALKVAGIIYHKTTVGVSLLSSIDPEIVADRSAAFAKFRSQILPYCSWMSSYEACDPPG